MIPRPWEGGSLASFNDFITELRRRRVFRALLVWASLCDRDKSCSTLQRECRERMVPGGPA